jgi:hypothetical protein
MISSVKHSSTPARGFWLAFATSWSVQKQLIEAEARQLVQTDLDAMLTPLRERVAKLEGMVNVLLGDDTANSPTRSKRAKQSPDNGHGRLLEHRPQ